MITYGSVCSGIEAATVAWEPLGWRPLWFAQFDPEHLGDGPDFPSAVLEHHYPDVPNCGSMILYPHLVREGILPAPDVLVGGTPCTSWSGAGARKGLEDPNGQLMLHFIELANAIDEVRIARGQQPCIILWENVPGVLTSRDNGFGHLLAGLAGDEQPCEPGPRPDAGPGTLYWRRRKGASAYVPCWPYAGAVVGPLRSLSWRVLDAKYHGVAQRRERVFVVASARDGFDPGAVLFESEGVRRDTPPKHQAREDVAATLTGGARKRGGYSTDDIPLRPCTIRGADIAPALDANCDRKWGSDQWVNGGMGILEPTASTLLASDGGSSGKDRIEGRIVVEPFVKTPRSTSDQDGEIWRDGQPVSPTLTAHPRDYRDGQTQAVVLQEAYGQNRQSGPVETSHALNVHGGPHGRLDFESETFIAQEIFTGDGVTADPITAHEARTYTQEGSNNFRMHNCVGQGPTYRVRRLLPVECEKLQGFPPGYTAIPWKGKPAEECPDDHRYKAIGNSFAVPVVRWIGRRIAKELGRCGT